MASVSSVVQSIVDFHAITDPADIGATEASVTLTQAAADPLVLTWQEALELTKEQLADTVALQVVYTGRISAGAQPQVVFDVQLRAQSRATGEDIVPPASPEQLVVDNTVAVAGEDLVGYPGVEIRQHDDSATDDIEINTPGIGVEVTKTFEPDAQVEPDNSPMTVTLTGRPEGPSRANLLQIEDIDASFWNQYDFVGLASPFPLTDPINQIRVDVLTGGEFVLTDGDVEIVGAEWVNGTTGAEATLPDVPLDEVQGLRFTVTRNGDQIWENPATPTQEFPFQVVRRDELRTGGPVPSTLAGNEPPAGETVAGEDTNTVDGLVQGRDLVDGEPISAVDDAEDVITYRHQPQSVQVTKAPNGSYPIGEDIPYLLTYTNTGSGPIVNPVITDRLPSDEDGPLLVFNEDLEEDQSPYTFGLTGPAPEEPNGPAMPVSEDDIVITVNDAGDLITFEFPERTVLEAGQAYTIGVNLQFRSGLPGGTDVTNSTGIVADRPWDECAGVLDEETGECTADTTVEPVSSGALRGAKSVRALDPALGVASPADVTCEPTADGFYVGRCTPITKPGEQNEWRLAFTNTGNQPIGRVVAVDRLPRPGDNAAIVPLPRHSQWKPLLDQVELVGSTSGSIDAFQVSYTSEADLCLDDLDMGAGCPAEAWQPWSEDVDPHEVQALKFEIDFNPTDRLEPLGRVTIDLLTTAPAQAPLSDDDALLEMPIAWNTVAAAAQSFDGDVPRLIRRTEGNKVWATLATGPLQVIKELQGEAAGAFAPETFDLTVQCVLPGDPEDLEDDIPIDLGDQTELLGVTPDQTVSLEHIPWGAECTVADDSADSGASEFDATTVTIVLEDQTVPVVIATNTYHYASLAVTKEVSSDAVDADGTPIGYGPFDYEVACTFLGDPVLADGFDTSPMLIELATGEAETLTGLPAAAECTLTETGTDGAAEVIAEGETGDGPSRATRASSSR